MNALHHHAKRYSLNMLEGSLLDKIVLFALPFAVSSILQQLFNAADLAVVGRFASSEAMAAVGSNSSVINLIISLFVGLSVGVNTVIAGQIGGGHKERINETVHTVISVAFLAGFALIFIGYAVSGPILKLMGAPENVMNLATVYLRIYFLDTESGYQTLEAGIPFWKWILSPILVLGAEGSGALIAVIIFLLVIGGVFNALNECGLMNYMLQTLVGKYGSVRYRLMAVLIFFFMAMGSLVGSFEEIVPFVPIIVSLAIGLGWDAVTGIAISLLAAGCGFAAGVANPFTIGVAQTIAGLPMFSGIWLRLVSFVSIYVLLFLFVY